MKKITTKVVLRKQRQLNDGRYPIKLRITINRKSDYFSLPLNQRELLAASEEDWKNIHSLRIKNTLKELKRKVHFYEERAQELVDNWNSKQIPLTSDNFKVRFFNSKEDVTLAEAFNEVINELDSEGRVGTALSYENAKKSILSYNKNKDLELEEIDEDFLGKYDRWMRSNNKSVSTIGIYLRSMRRVLNTCIKKGYLNQDQYPFSNYKIPTSENNKRFLTKGDISKISNLKTVKGSAKWRAQQYFILSYLLQGINFADIALLKNSNFKNGRIEYIRSKTKLTSKKVRPISIKVNEQRETIINSLRTTNTEQDEYVFPILSKGLTPKEQKNKIKQFTKNTSAWLKKIASELGINAKISTIFARHSYATTLIRMNKPTTMIQQAFNHSSIQMTENYIGGFDTDEIDAANENLL